MTTARRNTLVSVMNLAWSLVKKNGFTLSEAMKTAWRNINLKKAMTAGIVKFYFMKIDGTLREAYGTLKESLLPPTQGNRRVSPTTQTYFDTEKQEWRCFKIANLVRIA